MANNTGSRQPEINVSGNALDIMKAEIANELGIPNYDKMNKGDLPARVHGKIGGNMVRRMVSNYEALMTNPDLANLIHQSNPVADMQLAQDKQIVQERYGEVLRKEEQEAENPTINQYGSSQVNLTANNGKATVLDGATPSS